MAEMTRRERIMAASRKERADKLPFFHYWRHCQIGWAERECRNRGMGINWLRPSYAVTIHDVDISETRVVSGGQVFLRRTYSTPVGSIYEEEKREPGVGQWHALRSWRDVTPWNTSRLIKRPEDYAVLKYIVEHTEYTADYFPIEQAMEWLGEDGVVLDTLPHSPMQMLMIDWIGSEGGRFFYHHADYPDLVEDLYQAICKSREPLYEIAAQSPAPIVLCGDNVDGVLVNPKLFEKYFMPEYEKQAQILHAHGKLMAVHMDGRVGVLKELIAQTSIDIIEALHPPPMGNLPIGEALSLWKDKVIWIGFPASIYAMGPEATKRYALDLLREIGPGDRVVVTMSTENLVSNENLCMLTAVLEQAELPLTAEKIERIARSS
ncbi:MAG: hypothetical protein D6736_11795 [Nitrospinota bacterium]|nr:MAG: hypothetical protein D6736_11795 [Nitrospinota bacterium]